MADHSQFRLFSERRFMPFFMTQGLGAFNDNIFKNALAALLVFEGSRLGGLNTDQVVNLSAMLFILPFFLFSALFGQFADKYEKSLQIRNVKLFEVVIMALATLGFWIDSVPLLLFVLFLLGLQSTIFGPIKYGILPQILKREELVGPSSRSWPAPSPARNWPASTRPGPTGSAPPASRWRSRAGCSACASRAPRRSRPTSNSTGTSSARRSAT